MKCRENILVKAMMIGQKVIYDKDFVLDLLSLIDRINGSQGCVSLNFLSNGGCSTVHSNGAVAATIIKGPACGIFNLTFDSTYQEANVTSPLYPLPC